MLAIPNKVYITSKGKKIDTINYRYVMKAFENTLIRLLIRKDTIFDNRYYNKGLDIHHKATYDHEKETTFTYPSNLAGRIGALELLVKRMKLLIDGFPQVTTWTRYVKTLTRLRVKVEDGLLVEAFLEVFSLTPTIRIWFWYWEDMMRVEDAMPEELYRFKIECLKGLTTFVQTRSNERAECVKALKVVVKKMNKAPRDTKYNHMEPLCKAALETLCSFKLVEKTQTLRQSRFVLNASNRIELEKTGLYVGRA